MIRYRIQELLADKQFKEGRRVTLLGPAKATDISRVTLSKMVNQRSYGTLTDHLDKLCSFFGCRIEQLAEHITNSSESHSQSNRTMLFAGHSGL
jgi:putative transcriptional regulator